MAAFLLDTNVVSARRRIERANPGVRAFIDRTERTAVETYISVVTVGELRRDVDSVHFRGDSVQADILEEWLAEALEIYRGSIIEFDLKAAEVRGALRARRPEHPIDKQIAATTLGHGPTVATRNEKDFLGTGVQLLIPFV